ncbi:MAG: dihydrodipicolinate synthase family protein [Caldilineaceae bacterium]|nr:dihydrodipicolinate synthase family protein [Caldilineaceae bacterium]
MMSEKFWITGLVAAVFTPMHEDGSINFARIHPMVEQLLAEGVCGLYVCGSTGEGVSLTTPERMDVTAAFVKASAERAPVIVQVGHNSLEEARNLAAHAEEVGADAISATPPTYFKPSSLDNLIDCLAYITTGAPELPFYYYHIPIMTGVPVVISDFLRSAAPRLPSLAGVKFSHTAVFDLQASIAVDDGRFNLLFGSDEMLLGGLAAGAHGAVGSTYNFSAPLFTRIEDAFAAGDLSAAQALQGRAVEMIATIVRHGGNPALKAVMSLVGQDCGASRLPQITLPQQKIDALRMDLEAIGFFDWARNPAALEGPFHG